VSRQSSEVTPSQTKVRAVLPRSLHITQAANYLGVTVSFLRGLHWSRELRGVILGKRLVFAVADLDAYFEKARAAR
jgi:excisionase family DNA binding protein